MVYEASWESLDKRPIPEWFENAKFGIFIHWGVYSVPAWRKIESAKYASYAEWYYARVMNNELNGGKDFHEKNFGKDFEYRDFAPLFKAELFDPAFYAELFKSAGAKYVVLTSKHHDGFCLFGSDSKHKRNWNAVEIGPMRDLVGDLTRAVKDEGLKMGLYYSIPEWESIGTHKTESGWFIDEAMVKKYGVGEEKYVSETLLVELKQLIEGYEPSLLFSDGGEWDMDEDFAQTKEFLSWLYSESKVRGEIVVNDRFAKGMPGQHGDYYSSEYADADLNSDGKTFHPWEESRGIGGSYGFNRAERLADYQSTEGLIYELVDVVSRGGNFLLNVGPTADGRIPVIMEERLREIGKWLNVNGRAIYETRRCRLNQIQQGLAKIWFTQKEKELFVFFDRFEDFLEIKLDDVLNLKMVGDKEKRAREENIGTGYATAAELALDLKLLVLDVKLLGWDGQITWSWKENERGKETLLITLPKLIIHQLPCLHLWTLQVLLT